MSGVKNVPNRLTLLNESEQPIGETYDCLVDWAAGLEGHLINVTSPAQVPIPPGEAASFVQIRDANGELFWTYPLVGRPVRGGFLVLNPEGLL